MTTRGAAAIVAGRATGAVTAIAALSIGAVETTGTVIARSTARAIGTLATLAGLITGARRRLGLVDAVERNLTALVNLEHAYLHLVADIEHVLDLIHATLCDTGDVQQTVLARQQGHESTERLDGDDAACVLLARLRNLDDELDALDGLLDGVAGAADVDGTVLLNIDGGAGLILNASLPLIMPSVMRLA